MEQDEVDFAVAAWREDGRWSVSALPPRATTSLNAFTAALRQLTAEGGALGFLAVDEEFFIAVRVTPDGVTRLVLSDLNAAYEWPLAEEAADLLEVDVPEDEEEIDDLEPVGDVTLFVDLGVPVDEMELILGDPDLYPDEQVTSIATRIGFADQLSTVLESIDKD